MRKIDRAPGQVTEGMLPGIALQALKRRLPDDWRFPELIAPAAMRDPYDTLLTIETSNRERVRIAVEVKRLLEPRDVERVAKRLRPGVAAGSWDIGLVASRYLSPNTRDRLRAEGLSFVDATGNVYVRSDHPAIFISANGLDHDPWRGPGRPRGTLKGGPAAQVVRALLDESRTWRIRELIERAQASTGSVYRVVEFLESEALLTRGDADGVLVVEDWTALLHRWAADYTFTESNAVTRWIAPRGIEHAANRIVELGLREVVVTGSLAAAAWEPYAPARSLMAYSADARATASALGLRETDAGANVLLAEPAYAALTRNARESQQGLVIAAPAQVAADLLGGPGRAPSEAQALIEWMVAHEAEWR